MAIHDASIKPIRSARARLGTCWTGSMDGDAIHVRWEHAAQDAHPPCRSHADVAPALQASRGEYFPAIHARPDDVPPAASSQPRKPRDCCAAHKQPSSMKTAISPEN